MLQVRKLGAYKYTAVTKIYRTWGGMIDKTFQVEFVSSQLNR